jgi:protein-disulfide isomerase
MTISATAQNRVVEGAASSPVRVVIYEDLQCSDCAVFRQMLDTHLLPMFAAQAAFEHRDFPLPKHSWARRAAVAARYFDTLGSKLGVAFRRETLGKLAAIAPEQFDSHVAAFAKAHGKDGAAATAAMADPKLNALVDEDYKEGVARGVAKTPTVFVNGEPFVETFTVEAISKSIAAAVAAEKR